MICLQSCRSTSQVLRCWRLFGSGAFEGGESQRSCQLADVGLKRGACRE